MRGVLTYNEPMSRHTSWQVGGPAERFYRPADVADLAEFLAGLPAGEPVMVVGLGSNLLVRDGGIRGTVVLTHHALQGLALEADGCVYAEAGVADAKVARFASRHDLTGAEFLAGIPGTVGGALAMNAGCYGAETWDIVTEVETVDRRGVRRRRRKGDFTVGYRHVAPKVEGEWFVAARFRLAPGKGETSRQRVRELMTQRAKSQPLAQPNAGSVFRNPAGDHAGRLIEACGLKGAREGGAQVSEKHANFIVNTGGATAADIERLIGRVRDTVRERCGVELVSEVRIVGEA